MLIADNLEVTHFKVWVLERGQDRHERFDLVVELAEILADLFRLGVVFETFVFQVAQGLDGLVDVSGQGVAVKLCNLGVHPDSNFSEILGRQSPQFVEWLKFLLDDLDATKVCLRLAK